MNQNVYKEVPASEVTAVRPIPGPTYTTPYENDFTKAARDFWRKKNMDEVFRKGMVIGKFSQRDVTNDVFFETLYTFIKELITSNLIEQNKTSEELKSSFIILQNILKLIEKQTKDNKFNTQELVCMLHGFTNGYIENIKERIE